MEKVLQLLEKYQVLDIENAVDFKKFNQYLVSHHSTRIEGSTLTYVETTVLLEEGLTPKGKPLVHTLMQKNHYEALLFTLEKSNQLHIIPSLIQEINAHVLRTTGQVYNTVLGQVDATKGEYRKGTVFAGQTTFVNYAKIDEMVKTLCAKINTQLSSSTTTLEKLILSFEAHYELVNIHPFYDGNGRTSRLLSNAIQNYFGLPLAIVHSEDKVEYIESLIASRNADTTLPFLNFMFEQYEKHLENQIQLFQKG